ncbi:clpC [Symbiodinium sp. CCMP2592]|nr:clpC [Symbiodinium sp. CCMP2592]
MHVAPICRLATSRPFILGFGQQICCRTTSTHFSGGWRISPTPARLLRGSCGWYSDIGRPAVESGLKPGRVFLPGRLAELMPETGPTGRCGYGLGPFLMDRAFYPRPVAAAALRQHSAADAAIQQLVGTAWDAAWGAREDGEPRKGRSLSSFWQEPVVAESTAGGDLAFCPAVATRPVLSPSPALPLLLPGLRDQLPRRQEMAIASPPSSGLFGEGTPVEVRVEAWRRAFGLADDEEFAYVFMSAEEAQRQAGAEIAAKWREVRERVDEGKALAFAHEAAQAGAAELADLWVDAKVQRPSGELNAGRQAEWENFVRRRAAKVCSEAEVATIKKAVVSLRELQHFQVARGRDGLEEVDTLDLDAFIFNSAAPHRCAVAGLRWAAKQAELTWKIPDAPRTEQRRKPRDERQATLAEPPMLVHLEKVIEERCIMGDPRWTAMLGQWMQASSCMRYAHLRRSEVLRITGSTVHAFCNKGKAPPAALPKGRRSQCGLCFDARGFSWSLRESTLAVQAAFTDVVANPEELTSYSWRRLGPSVAMLAQLSPGESNALGDWQDRVSDQRSAMPVHYSGLRYKESVRVKHLVWAYMGELRPYPTWDAVTPQDVAEHTTLAQSLCETQVRADKELLWQGPAFAAHKPKKFTMRLAAPLARRSLAGPVLPLAKLRSKRRAEPKAVASSSARPSSAAAEVPAPGSPMPPYIGRHKTSQNFKDGAPALTWVTVGVDPIALSSTGALPPSSLQTESAAGSMRPWTAAQRNMAYLPATSSPDNRQSRRLLPDGVRPTHRPKVMAGETPEGGWRQVVTWLPRFPWLRLRGRYLGGQEQVWVTGARHRLRYAGLTRQQRQAPRAFRTPPAPDPTEAENQAVFDNLAGREEEWLRIFSAVARTLLAGHNVLLHCMAGRHRAATTGVACRAVLAGETQEEANQAILRVRQIEVDRAIQQDRSLGPWLAGAVRNTRVPPTPVQPRGYIATASSHLHLESPEEGVPICKHKQGIERRRLANPQRTTSKLEAIGWERPICEGCFSRASSKYFPV